MIVNKEFAENNISSSGNGNDELDNLNELIGEVIKENNNPVNDYNNNKNEADDSGEQKNMEIVGVQRSSRE